MSDEATSPKISIVAPVYKVEKYLRDCVESVLAQTFTDFELILVDDGSPDRCGEICDEYAKKDSHIRVFHQENGGVTSARRLGVEQARGEWICFVDPDDLLPPNSLKDLFDEATDDVDWVLGKLQEFNDGETPSVETLTGDVKSFDWVSLAENMFLHHAGPCAQIVRRKLFSPNVLDIPREIKVADDTLTNIRLIANKPRSAREIDKIVYYYRIRRDSVYHSHLLSENYILRISKLFLAEIEKLPTHSRERVQRALLPHLRIVDLMIYGIPIKSPRKLAKIMHSSSRSRPKLLFIYLCLRFGYPYIARLATRIYFFLRGMKLDIEGKTFVE